MKAFILTVLLSAALAAQTGTVSIKYPDGSGASYVAWNYNVTKLGVVTFNTAGGPVMLMPNEWVVVIWTPFSEPRSASTTRA